MMDRMRSAPRALRIDRSGAVAIEYAMIALFIAIVLISGILSIGSSVTGFFMQINNGF